MSEPAIYKNGKLSFFFLSFFLPGLTQDCLDLQSSLNINQLHFIMHSEVVHRFYHSFSYHSESFSANFVARFITECHFVAMYACSEPHAPHTFIGMAPQAWLAHRPAHIQYSKRTMLAFWRRLIDPHAVQTLCYFSDTCMETWPWLCNFVKVWLPNTAIVSSLISCHASFRPHPSQQLCYRLRHYSLVFLL